jgi:hypothetical protein
MGTMPFYVTVMDHHVERYPGQLVYVHKDDTVEDAMLHKEYDQIIGQLPRDQYEEQKIARNSLEYTPTGEKHDGAVYKLTPR